ncbi:Caspase-10, partial [Pseudolycoriella hygida]
MTKGIVAKLREPPQERNRSNGEKFGKYLFKQGKSRIDILAFGNTYEIVKNILKVGELTKFPPETFSCQKRNKKFDSNSTCTYDLTFQPWSSFINRLKSMHSLTNTPNTTEEFCDLKKVLQLLRTKQMITKKLKSITFSGGKNIQLSGESNETINSAVVFNSLCELLLKKKGDEFNTDNEAVAAWNELIANSSFNITLKRKKMKKGSAYLPAIIVDAVDEVTPRVRTLSSSTSAEHATELPFKLSSDARVVNQELNPKVLLPIPDFPEFEIKLESTPERYEEWIPKYRINSKPPGLVLLINNFNFPLEEIKQRFGSEKDINKLFRIFTEMGYAIFGNKCYVDIKTKVEFAKLIRDFKDELIEKNYDSLFIVISSHGANNEVSLSGIPEQSVCVVQDVMAPFSDKNFPQYTGKPKVFMPITCQNFGKSELGNGVKCTDNHLFDMLICCPCLPGYLQRRYFESGSLFVDRLVRNL